VGLILAFAVVTLISVVYFRLINRSWAYALSTAIFVLVIQFAGAATRLRKAHRHGLSGRDYSRLRFGVWRGAVPDDLVDHVAETELEIKSTRLGGILMLGFPTVLLSAILIFVVTLAIRGEVSPWYIAFPAAVLALIVGIGVQAIRGSTQVRKRLAKQ